MYSDWLSEVTPAVAELNLGGCISLHEFEHLHCLQEWKSLHERLQVKGIIVWMTPPEFRHTPGIGLALQGWMEEDDPRELLLQLDKALLNEQDRHRVSGSCAGLTPGAITSSWE